MLERARNRWRLRGLLKAWVSYRRLALDRRFSRAAGKDAHLDLQARIASKLRALTDALPPDRREERRAGLEAVSELLGRATDFQGDDPRDVRARRDFERDWQESYIFLNTLKAIPLEAPAEVQPAEPPFVPTGVERTWLGERVSVPPPVRFVVVVLVLGSIGYLSWPHLGAHVGTAVAALRAAGEDLQRRFAGEPAPEESPAPVDHTPSVRAFVDDGLRASVQIRVGGVTSDWLSEGETFRDWTVVRIVPDSIRVAQGERELVLKAP